jgi:intracellular septation protein A
MAIQNEYVQGIVKASVIGILAAIARIAYRWETEEVVSLKQHIGTSTVCTLTGIFTALWLQSVFNNFGISASGGFLAGFMGSQTLDFAFNLIKKRVGK